MSSQEILSREMSSRRLRHGEISSQQARLAVARAALKHNLGGACRRTRNGGLADFS
jgi:hypothetical protein